MKVQLTRFHDGAWHPPLPAGAGGGRDLILVFGDVAWPDAPSVFEALSARYPDAAIVGCSTAGQILDASVYDGEAVAAVVSFDSSTVVQVSTTARDEADSQAAGSRIAALLPHEGLRGVFVLAPGIDLNGSALVQGIREHLPEGVPTTGGLAGDYLRFERTWVAAGAECAERTVAAVGFYGESLTYLTGCAGGWQPFGPKRLVTKSEGNVLFELDDKPALALYKTYLGDLAAELPGSAMRFPLSVTEERDGDAPVIRSILGVDEPTQSMTFAGDVPQGSYAQLMRAVGDELLDGAAAAAAAADTPARKPALTIAVSCVGRRDVLGEDVEEELDEIQSVLGSDVPQVGFYSYGEVAPSGLLTCELHNETMTLTALHED